MKASRTYLKNLDILYTLLSATFLINGRPLADDALDVGHRKPCESKVMPRVKYEHVTCTLNRGRS
jgi:hypothetical protein